MMGRIERGRSCLDGYRLVGWLPCHLHVELLRPLCNSILVCVSALSPSYGVSEQEKERERGRRQKKAIFRGGERERGGIRLAGLRRCRLAVSSGTRLAVTLGGLLGPWMAA